MRSMGVIVHILSCRMLLLFRAGVDANPHGLATERTDVRRPSGAQQTRHGGEVRDETHAAVEKKL